MPKNELSTVREVLFWSYANLAMAHTAEDRKQEKYAAFNYMIRAKLFKGLIDGTMNKAIRHAIISELYRDY